MKGGGGKIGVPHHLAKAQDSGRPFKLETTPLGTWVIEVRAKAIKFTSANALTIKNNRQHPEILQLVALNFRGLHFSCKNEFGTIWNDGMITCNQASCRQGCRLDRQDLAALDLPNLLHRNPGVNLFLSSYTGHSCRHCRSCWRQSTSQHAWHRHIGWNWWRNCGLRWSYRMSCRCKWWQWWQARSRSDGIGCHPSLLHVTP